MLGPFINVARSKAWLESKNMRRRVCDPLARSLSLRTSGERLYFETYFSHGPGAFQFGALLFWGRADYEPALGSPASELDSQSGGFCNVCPNFEPHPHGPRHLTKMSVWGMVILPQN